MVHASVMAYNFHLAHNGQNMVMGFVINKNLINSLFYIQLIVFYLFLVEYLFLCELFISEYDLIKGVEGVVRHAHFQE